MSFYTSLTGLNAATAMLGVTSNNIANVGTTGFKRSRADFGDIFATSPLQKASSTVGQGVSLKQVSQEFNQGNISFSSNALDLAVTGDGFFPMRSADGLQETYTRNGSFLLNEQFNVVNSAGQRLMAATVDSTGSANVNERVVLTIPQKTSGEAKQTSQVSLGLNFPADASTINTTFNRTNPATYNKSTAFTVYDAGGNGYLATVYYVKTKNADQASPFNKWQTHVFIGEDQVTASLQQATDKNGQKLYVNQYGQLQPYNVVKDELTTAKTQLISLNELTDTKTSVPAALPGAAVTGYDFSNGVDMSNLLLAVPAVGVSGIIATAGNVAALTAASSVINTAKATLKGKTATDLVTQTMLNNAAVLTSYGISVPTLGTVGTAIGASNITALTDMNTAITTLQTSITGTTAGTTTLTTATAAAIQGQITTVNASNTATLATLSKAFTVDVDNSGAPVDVDLSYLTKSTTKLTGSAIAAEITNQLNRKFGDDAYFNLSDASSRSFQITSDRLDTSAVSAGTTVITPHPVTINLVEDPVSGPIKDIKSVTTDQLVAAIQAQINTQVGADTIKVSYNYSTQGLQFTDGTRVTKLSSTQKNDVLKLGPTAVTLDENGLYDGKVIANGAPIRLPAEQRFGMQMTYDSVNKVFSLKSGTTGDKSSIAISNCAANSIGNGMFGLLDASVATSYTALRGTASTPAIALGTTPLKNVTNNFAVDESNNKFIVTVNGVKGTVVIPVRGDYSLDTFKSELQKGINALGSNSVEGVPVTVNGVKVEYNAVSNRFEFTSGTAGANSFVKISGSSDWGLDQVEAARGTDSTWIKPTQHKDIIAGVAQPKFIDGTGKETTSGDGFANLPAWSPVFLDKGELTFDTSGKLVSPLKGTQLDPVFLAGGKGVLTINVNYSASTQYTSPFAVLSQSQDGAPEGDLVGVTIGNDGLVSASFSNGTQKSLAKILLANFSSPVGLRQMGDSTFLASAASGKPILGNAGSAGFGTLRAGATERANVDLTQELVDLITAQRNFQANAKAIETSSTMTSAIINLRS